MLAQSTASLRAPARVRAHIETLTDDPVDLYSKVPICDIKLQWCLCFTEALSYKGSFFNITADALQRMLVHDGVDFAWDSLRDDCIAAFALPKLFRGPSWRYEEFKRLKKMRGVFARCCVDSGSMEWLESLHNASGSDELDRLLKIGQENKFLKSFLWALPAKEFGKGNKDHFLASEHFAAAMVKYNVPLHPHHLPLAFTGEATEAAWMCHFCSMHNYVVRCRRMIKMKHAFAKLYHRCFARAFKDPLGKARQREAETAAADFEEHVAKRMSV